MKRLFIIAAAFAALSFFAVSCGEGENSLAPRTAKIEKRTDGPVSVIVVGDTMFDDLALPYIIKYGYEYQLSAVRDLLMDADVVNANLEVAVSSGCKRSKKKFAYYMLPEGLSGLTENGVNVVCLANNHVLDCGEKGMTDGLKHMENAGLHYYGAGLGEDRHRGVVVDVDGTRIGFVGWYNYRLEKGHCGTAHISEQAVKADIAAVKRKADVVIATFHWGKNYEPKMDKKQKFFGRLAIDSGADAVVGHHPHIPQAMTVYKGKPIIYSVGNFCFSTGNNSAAEGFAAKFFIEGKRIARLEMIPLFVQMRNEQVRWQTRPAEGRRAQKTLGSLVKASRKHDVELTVKDNAAVLTF